MEYDPTRQILQNQPGWIGKCCQWKEAHLVLLDHGSIRRQSIRSKRLGHEHLEVRSSDRTQVRPKTEKQMFHFMFSPLWLAGEGLFVKFYLRGLVLQWDDTTFNHFIVQVVSFTGSFSDTSKDWVTTVSLSDVVNKFHNQYSFSDTSTTEQTCIQQWSILDCIIRVELLDSRRYKSYRSFLPWRKGPTSRRP